MKKFRFGLLIGLFFHLASAPSFADSFKLQLGKLFADGQTTQIEQTVLRELQHRPDSLDLWLELAALREARGDYAGTLEAYEKCLSQHEDSSVRGAFALTLERAGRFPEAAKELRRLYKQHPNNDNVLWGLARLCLYQSRWKGIRTQASPEKALRESQKYLLALTVHGTDCALYEWQLAEVSRQLGDDDVALGAYERTLRLDPNFKWVHRYIARLLAGKKRHHEAQERYERAMNIDPEDRELKEEARQEALKAPQTAARRVVEKLQAWKAWISPEERPMATSSVTVRVGIATDVNGLVFKSKSELDVLRSGSIAGAFPTPPPLAILPPGEDYQVSYLPAKRSATHEDIWTVKTVKGKSLVSFTERVWIVPKNPSHPVLLHSIFSNKGYFFAKEEDRAYRGVIEILPKRGSGFNVINPVSLEAYTAGVLPAEMLSNWPLEALKAQAILVRAYVLSKLTRHRTDGFDVCDGVHCQVYGGVGAETSRTNKAVNETAGMVLKHGGKIIPVAYSAQCGGHTQGYEGTWGEKLSVEGVADYDQAVNQNVGFPLSPYDMKRWILEDPPAYCRTPELRGYRNYRWAWVATAESIEKKAGAIGKLCRLVVLRRSNAGWANRLLVEGDKGSKEYKGDMIRGLLGGIRSNLIWIEPQFNLKGRPEEFIIYGGGWGHGVGLCQVGAYGLARTGKTCGEILRHYFPSANLEKI